MSCQRSALAWQSGVSEALFYVQRIYPGLDLHHACPAAPRTGRSTPVCRVLSSNLVRVPASTRGGVMASRCRECGLTPRSRRGPTANRQARLQVGFIILPPGLALCRRSRLNSNVRRRRRPPASIAAYACSPALQVELQLCSRMSSTASRTLNVHAASIDH